MKTCRLRENHVRWDADRATTHTIEPKYSGSVIAGPKCLENGRSPPQSCSHTEQFLECGSGILHTKAGPVKLSADPITSAIRVKRWRCGTTAPAPFVSLQLFGPAGSPTAYRGRGQIRKRGQADVADDFSGLAVAVTGLSHGIDCGRAQSVLDSNQTTPYANIASATLVKPAMFAPRT